MRILIIRHAEPDYAHNTLTPRGFREADILSERLSCLPIGHLYSSPLQRALLTAEPTAQKLGREVEVCDWLREFGGKIPDEDGKERIPWNLPPRFWEKREKLYDVHTWLQDSIMSAMDVPEKFRHVEKGLLNLLECHGYRRMGAFFTCEENKDETIALFCHFGLGMLLVSILTGISPVLLWQGLFLPTSSVSTFVTEERNRGEVVFKCLQLGDTSHLYAKGEPVSRSGLYREHADGYGDGPQV